MNVGVLCLSLLVVTGCNYKARMEEQKRAAEQARIEAEAKAKQAEIEAEAKAKQAEIEAQVAKAKAEQERSLQEPRARRSDAAVGPPPAPSKAPCRCVPTDPACDCL